MPAKHIRKIKLRVLYDLLSRYTDEDHHLSTDELVALLKDNGITVGKKALISDIKYLNEYGYEVQSYRKRWYYFYVVDRAFDTAELKILIDAVQAANFIPENKTLELIDKIADLAGSHRAEGLKRNVVCYDTNKHTNKYVFYTVNTLLTAIEEKKKASFLYYDFDITKNKVYRKSGERYVVNPVALTYTNDKYYLVCYSDKYKNLSNYRVDRMERVQAENEDITLVKEFENFNINAYRRQMFSMYVGEFKTVEITADNGCIDVILDRFGEQTHLIRLDDNTFKVGVQVQVSPAFFGWVLLSQRKIRITAPAEVCGQMDEYIESVMPQR
ncbi:hypothetical protein FACS1894211_01010 [Clostridia bacterium]|nr:hypothetical protein FACS1894211_01010 [Clostridia bacterium]